MRYQIFDDTEMFSGVSTPRELRRVYAWVAVSIMLLSAYLVVDDLIQSQLLIGTMT